MDELNNYTVIGLDNYNALRDELAVLRYENQNLHSALDNAVASNMDLQDRINIAEEEEES